MFVNALRFVTTVTLVSLLAIARDGRAQTVLHVDTAAAPNGNGLSWATAFDRLDAALAAAQSNTNVQELWVARGTYAAASSFTVRDNLAVYGGFSGTEINRLGRNPGRHVTILDGGGTHTVVTFSNNATPQTRLDGFTVTRGFARNGGGIYSYGGSPTLANLIIIANTSTERSGSGGGGGAYFYNGSPQISNTVFDANTSTGDGGGLYDYEGHPVLVDVVFRRNSTTGQRAPGGGCYTYSGNARLTNVQFLDNTATDGGGGFWNYEGAPQIVDCLFVRNRAGASGGGLWNYNGTIKVINTSFTGNNAASDGGGAWTYQGGTFTGCIFRNDTAPSSPEIRQTGASVTYSCVQGGFAGTGNINADPRFRNVAADDYRLAAGSPCIDAADNAALPAGTTGDLAHSARLLDDPLTADTGNGTAPIVDMGAHEYAIDFPGTGEDLLQVTSVGAASPLETGTVKLVRGNDIVNVLLRSPNGTFDGAPVLLGIQIFTTGSPPNQILPGVHITPGIGAWILFGGLSPTGFGISLRVPGATPVGFSFLVQTGVGTTIANNNIYASADATEFRMVP